jgi:hypothetical protein
MTGESARAVLASNLRRLLKHSKTVPTLVALEKATEEHGLKVGKSTIDRATKGETPLNLDALEVIAAVFGLSAWQLLVPDITPGNPPILKALGEAEEQLYRKLGQLAKEIADLPQN